jgi:membrane-associated phospholipid phosphatase
MTPWAVDTWVARGLAALLAGHPSAQRAVVVLAETGFTKTLFFVPFLLLAWIRGEEREREHVLVLCGSCAVALVPVWVITSQWVRFKPMHPEHGVAEVAAIFAPFFASKPDYFSWGSFPSDNAAFLGAMSFGLLRVRPGVGWTALAVTVGLNGVLRMAAGLHYLSDVIAGAAIGWLASVASFALASSAPVAPRLAAIRAWTDRYPPASGIVVLFLVEMAVMFHDLRFLDPVVFTAIAPGR